MDESAQGLTEIAYLMVVQRGEEDRFRYLRTTFRDKPVEVMWDRRQGQRRQETLVGGIERRRKDRRAQPPSSWQSLGFLVARRAV